MDFEQWMEKVDALATKKLGVSVYDLPDYCWRDAFDAGDSPRKALKNCLAEM